MSPGPSAPGAQTDLVALRRYLFAEPSRRCARQPATCGSSRRRARDARRSRSRGASSTKRARGVPFDEMAVFLRAPEHYARAARARAARAAASPPTSIAARGAPIRPAARSSRCSRARSRGCRRSGSTSTCRSARCRGRAARRAGVRRAARRRAARAAVASAPRAGATIRTKRRQRDSARRRDSDDEPVVAGTLRSPWKWEELIVESAVSAAHARDGNARWRRSLDGLAADYRYRSRS